LRRATRTLLGEYMSMRRYAQVIILSLFAGRRVLGEFLGNLYVKVLLRNSTRHSERSRVHGGAKACRLKLSGLCTELKYSLALTVFLRRCSTRNDFC